jgi:type VI secretion system secreted protein Hcp
MLACANGQIFSSPVIAGQRLDGPQYQFVTITLSNVSITSYQPRSNGSDLPTESISLSFTRIRMEYVPLNPDGTLGDPIVTTVDVSGGGGA